MRRASRRNTGFERAGNLPATDLGLPRELSRELSLSHAWERVAGPAIARRAPALSIRRGILEIEVASERWSDTLVPLLPRLAARLAALHPDFKIRKFRLRHAGEKPAAPPAAIDPYAGPKDEASQDSEEAPEPQRAPRRELDAGPVDRARLERLAARYLARDRS